ATISAFHSADGGMSPQSTQTWRPRRSSAATSCLTRSCSSRGYEMNTSAMTALGQAHRKEAQSSRAPSRETQGAARATPLMAVPLRFVRYGKIGAPATDGDDWRRTWTDMRSIVESTRAYEAWMRKRTDVSKRLLKNKNRKMGTGAVA